MIVRIVVEIPRPAGYTVEDVRRYVEDAVHAHAGAFPPEDSMFEDAKQAVVRRLTTPAAQPAKAR